MLTVARTGTHTVTFAAALTVALTVALTAALTATPSKAAFTPVRAALHLAATLPQ